MPSPFLSISIVVYKPDPLILAATLTTLRSALIRCGQTFSLSIIDNSEDSGFESLRSHPRISEVLARFDELQIVGGHGNVGYGRGHNFAIGAATSSYHLILNPDVELSDDALIEAIAWMQTHPEFGALAPLTVSPDGALQYLCRRYPSLWLLFLRGFAPAFMRRWFQKSLDRYEMKDLIDEGTILLDPPLISGCFMFFRTDVLKALGGFDARYFLYFEDYDLSLRTTSKGRLVYLPAVRIVHHGGNAAKKGMAHIIMFLRSARLFFSAHGWQLC